ncbi:putative glutathione S-transferase GSTF1 [Canna indica]|uniref:glutathione transferase n=1 Tax=Canna indica TaxID=4628 RepID=A0AAQ3L0H0_9LILI|nr:putative glutathione S-transferase GSTF1 [Canna indica]
MAPVKVYAPNMSTAAARVLLCLEEVGAEYEQVPINFATGEHKSPAHLARNPFGQVPALEDGDLMLFESRAIGRYVLRKFKSPGADLLHEDNLAESAMVNVWLEVEAQQYDKVMSLIFYQLIVIPVFYGGKTDEKVVAENLEKLCKVLDVYEARLSKSKYLAGDFLSFADISHIPLTHFFMSSPHASVFDARPHVKAWWESLASRPSYKKVTAAMSSK